MGGNQRSSGLGNVPNEKWQLCPAESNNGKINIINKIYKHITINPGWTNPNHLEKWTALLDLGASLTLVGNKAFCKIVEIQQQNVTLCTPNGGGMKATKTIELQLKHWPNKMTQGFLVPDIAHNIVPVAKIFDAGRNVFFTQHGVEVEFDCKIIAKGWPDPTDRLWRIPITSKGDTHNIPYTPKEAYDSKYGVVFNINTNVIWECKTIEQLTRSFYAILVSHPQARFLAAVKDRYLQGCPGLSEAVMQKYINVEPAT